MTEERKQKLSQLLEEAMESVKIPSLSEHWHTWIPKDVYRGHLQQRWQYNLNDSTQVTLRFKPCIESNTTKLKLLDFLREELAPFIYDDSIRSSIYIIEGSPADDFYLCNLRYSSFDPNFIIEHLLKITISQGPEKAASVFAKCSCPEGTQGFFQDVAFLKGIKLKDELPVCETVRLVSPVHLTTAEFGTYLPGSSFSNYNANLNVNRMIGDTLLIIDRPTFSVFHNTSEGKEPFQDKVRVDDFPFDLEVNGVKFADFDAVKSFRKLLCQALSLSCNSPVQVAGSGWYLPYDQFFDQNLGGTMGYSPGPFGNYTQVGESEIEEANSLNGRLTKLNTGTLEKLQIPINRWIKSKTIQTYEDKIIDLAIALESLYLPKDNIDQLAFQLSLRASWHLGKNKEDRKKLIDEFKAIYTLRSKAVHNGVIPQRVKIRKGESVPTSEFIPRAQDLCRRSIMKILEDGEFPDWNNLILG